MQPVEIHNVIRKIIKEETRPIPPSILMEKVKSTLSFDVRSFIYNQIDYLVMTGELKKLHNGYLVEGYLNAPLLDKFVKGIIIINSNGDGYIKINQGNNQEFISYYIHKINLNNAISNDEVEINLMDKYSKKDAVQHAVVSRIITHNTIYGVGTFKLIGNQYEVELDDKRNYLKVRLDNVENLINGYKLLIRFVRYDKDIAYGEISKIIGHINDVGTDVLSIVYAHNIEPLFDDEIIQFVNSYIPSQEMDTLRKDISDWTIITIDPSTSKDMDDAIYVEKRGDDYFLSVSIADVSSYVPYQSVLDVSSIKRGTSIYLVDRVIPMLPHKLSDDDCSLNEQVMRRTLTCDMIIDQLGNFKNIDVYPSWIKSQKKLSYDAVNLYYNNLTSNFNININKVLDVAKELHYILRNKKMNDGYIDLDIKEPLIVVDENCFPIDIKIRERGLAQKMIEDFMVAANCAVTIHAKKQNIPFIYRIHDKPSIDQLHRFAIEAKKLYFKIYEKDFIDIQPKTLSKWIENNRTNTNFNLINKLLLKCMAKAIYSTVNIGHFGLAASDYTHFTSPIRRYPDLIVHRLYWMYLFAPHKYTDDQRKQFSSELTTICDLCSVSEVNAVQTERDVNMLKFCQYMSKCLQKEFDGVISTVTAFGLFVELDNTIEGLVRLKNIGKDFWLYDAQSNSIYGEKTNKRFNYGDSIKIRVINVSVELRQIDFEIVGFEKIKNDDHHKKPFHKNYKNFSNYKKNY